MTAKTPAERQRALKQARRAAGLKQVWNLWCYPKDEPAIREFADRLLQKQHPPDRKEKKSEPDTPKA